MPKQQRITAKTAESDEMTRSQGWVPRQSLNPLLNPGGGKKAPLPGLLPGNRALAASDSTPTGSRTPVFGLRTRRPGPLDDGGAVAFKSTLGSSSVGQGVKQT
jgi:hypothetical protein